MAGGDLFISSYDNGTIGEYTLSGQVVNASLVTGLNEPQGLAILGGDLFVANGRSGTVGEYTLSGQTVNASLISGLNDPIAIVATPEPSMAGLAGLATALLFCGNMIRRRLT